jgi:hypothetical protein
LFNIFLSPEVGEKRFRNENVASEVEMADGWFGGCGEGTYSCDHGSRLGRNVRGNTRVKWSVGAG